MHSSTRCGPLSVAQVFCIPRASFLSVHSGTRGWSELLIQIHTKGLPLKLKGNCRRIFNDVVFKLKLEALGCIFLTAGISPGLSMYRVQHDADF